MNIAPACGSEYAKIRPLDVLQAGALSVVPDFPSEKDMQLSCRRVLLMNC
jgi:hypothetical protein